MTDISHLIFKKEQLINIQTNRSYNEYIIKYYERLKNDKRFSLDESKIANKIDSIKNCNKFFELDVYHKQLIKDFLRTNLCKDKFCQNCKKVKQASRMARFIPEIEKYKRKGLYHLVLTVPNVDHTELRSMIKKQFKAFGMLIRYLNGTKKIKGLDFDSWGFLGAIRSLEVTYKGNSYHPHIHALLCFTGDLGEKTLENTYSYNYQGKKAVLTRLFSEKEVLIQKIWRLLINGEKVTLKNISQMEVGYSCMIDKFKENDYHELFKYMTKSNGSDDDETSMMTYENFVTLYFALRNIRQIQGYGVFFRLKDADLSEEIDSVYESIIEGLKKTESPEHTMETPQELILDNKYTLISRKTVQKYLRQLQETSCEEVSKKM